MKYIILITGILSIFIVTILNFYPEESKAYIYNLFNQDEYVIAQANDYYLEGNFEYVQNWTDDVSNKKEFAVLGVMAASFGLMFVNLTVGILLHPTV